MKRYEELEKFYNSITLRLTESEANVDKMTSRLKEIVEKDGIIESESLRASELKEKADALLKENSALREEIIKINHVSKF